jgi:hypothetical protein
MGKKIFDLVYSDYDWQDHHFLEGPDNVTVEEFNKLCTSLLPKAGYQTVLRYLTTKKSGWICWDDVVESLIPLLEEQGYQRVSLDSYHLGGSNVVVGLDEDALVPGAVLGFSGPLIVQHNLKVEKKYREERKAKKFSSLKKKSVQIIK